MATQYYNLDSEEEEQPLIPPEDQALAADTRDNHQMVRMTPKIPPTFDGQSSWFEYEDLIDDWLGITTLTPERLGPSLKNSLVGAAEFYKNMLDNTLLRNPDQGVRHFKDVLRPYFVKGVNHVFLWRFLQLFRCYRGNQEFVHWIGKFEVTSRRVLTAWMDLQEIDVPPIDDVEFLNLLNPQQADALQQIQDGDERRAAANAIRDEHINQLRAQHRAAFPLTDNLMSLIFLVQADLNESQRERFVTSMSLRQVNMTQYTYLQVKALFMELFCVTRTGIADPTIRHMRRSTFVVLDEGEYEQEQGYWVVEQETGEEGFVSLFSEEEFWVLQAKGGYTRRRVHRRKFVSGKGKGRGTKGKRPGFKPRSKGKGYIAEESQTDTGFYGKGKGKGKKGKKGKKGNDAFKGNFKGGKSKDKQQQPSANVRHLRAHKSILMFMRHTLHKNPGVMMSAGTGIVTTKHGVFIHQKPKKIGLILLRSDRWTIPDMSTQHHRSIVTLLLAFSQCSFWFFVGH